MIAYMQSGEKLKPDHGFPVRLIIPGYIGGRMIKWLSKITITNKESDNFYHFRDNRILPPHVDEKLADSENWWEKPEYIFNELNINSAVTSPAHGEHIRCNYELNSDEKEYLVKGYAYTGGGRKITRCEISLKRRIYLGVVRHSPTVETDGIRETLDVGEIFQTRRTESTG